MQKILLLVVAVAAVAYANEIAARESARESEREALSAGNRERVVSERIIRIVVLCQGCQLTFLPFGQKLES